MFYQEFLTAEPVHYRRDTFLKNDKLQYAFNLLLNNPEFSIKQICSHLDFGERHFHRIFSREFGVAPKRFQRLLRIRKVINMMNSGEFNKLTDIAYLAGYCDQAHCIRDFKSFTNMTPKAFIQSNKTIASMINFRDEMGAGETGKKYFK